MSATCRDVLPAFSFASNVQSHPQTVQAALTQGMTTLTQIEARIKADSGNVNHMGIDISASHNAYMDFSTQKGTIADTAKEAKLGTAAQALTGDIKSAMQTQTLTMSERMQLMGVDVEMVAAYMGTAKVIPVRNAMMPRTAYP